MNPTLVYITINKITDSFYVGITSGNNKSQKGKYLGSGKVLKLSLIKYGRENFRQFILETCETRKMAALRESYWIKKCKEKWPNKRCYNLTVGGENGEQPSPESHKIIAEKLRQYYKDPKIKQKCREHAKNTINKHVKINGPHNKKLSESDIEYAKSEYESYNKTLVEIAKELNVSTSCVALKMNLKKGANGTGNGAAKLKEPQIIQIRKDYLTKNYTHKDLAIKYNISKQSISNILNKRTWGHI